MLLNQPRGHAVAPGGTARLAVAIAGTGPLACQWLFNGSPLAGRTNATLVLGGFSAAQAGQYVLRVSSPYGTVNSQPAQLALAPPAAGVTPPTILSHPASRVVAPGASVTLGVSASGTAPLRYQWHHNGLPISGATNQTLVRNGLTAAQAGAYQVLVQNAAGQAASGLALIRVTPAPAPRMVRLADAPALVVPSVPGPNYTLEARPGAAGGTWQPVATQPGTGGQIVFTNLAAGPARFFRVVAR